MKQLNSRTCWKYTRSLQRDLNPALAVSPEMRAAMVATAAGRFRMETVLSVEAEVQARRIAKSRRAGRVARGETASPARESLGPTHLRGVLTRNLAGGPTPAERGQPS